MRDKSQNERIISLEKTVKDLKNEGKVFSKDTLLHIIIPAFLGSLTIGLLTWLDLPGTPFVENSKIPPPKNEQPKLIYYPAYMLFSGIIGTVSAMALNSIPVNNGQRKQTTVSSFILGLSVPLSILTISNTSAKAKEFQEEVKAKTAELASIQDVSVREFVNLASTQTDPDLVSSPQFSRAIRSVSNLASVSPETAQDVYSVVSRNFYSARSRNILNSDDEKSISNQLVSVRAKIDEQLLLRIVNAYSIQIFYDESVQEQEQEAMQIKEALINAGVESRIEVAAQKDRASSDQIRYFQDNEREVATALQHILNKTYPSRSFILQTVYTPSPGYISIFLKSK